VTHLAFDVHGPAVPKGRPRVTRHGTYTPPRTREYEARVRTAARAANPPYLRHGAWPMAAIYKVTLHVVPLRPKKVGVKPPRGGDVDNVCKSILDALNGVLWFDDDMVSEVQIWRYEASHSPGVRVEVEVLPREPCPTWLAVDWPKHQPAPRRKRATAATDAPDLDATRASSIRLKPAPRPSTSD
jgi:Holliday junction resolvase RusA-like endonuclease